MPLRRLASWALALGALLALRCTAAGAGDLLLRYRFVEGDAFAYRYAATAVAPVLGEVVIRQTFSLRVVTVHDHGAAMHCRIAWDAMPGLDAGETTCAFVLGDTGRVTALAGPALEDPNTASMARNVGLFFPALPADEIAVGQSWTWPVRLHLPKGDKTLQAAVRFRLDGIETGGAGRLAVLDGVCAEKVSKTMKLDLRGVTRFAVEKGRLDRCDLDGTVKVRKALVWFSVPLKLRMESLPAR